MKTAEGVSTEARNCTISACVEDVDEVVMLDNGNRKGAASGRPVNEHGDAIQQMKAGNSSAACIDGEQEGAILAESERALRLKRVGCATAAAASAGNAPGEYEPAVGEMLVSKHLIFVSIICEDKDG
jgi:hypothetical protein